ncbi:MAG: glycine cleavage system aminomethyltransferase GcvT [Spirochaetaceae bacterium]|jgi:aminomethyltransferase|nr:glycine cleavage system aminomethyltransferase GcvT [Spirochaetaceae bacterium]
MEKTTPLYGWHESHGGKIVPFGGYLLPVQYETGVIAEHNAVRTGAGLFDVSHMGEFVLKGRDALANLQGIFTNDFAGMPLGRVRYTLLCNEQGGIIDDLVVCKMQEDRYMLVVNAANRDKDFRWICSKVTGDASFEDISDSMAQIALQGPRAEEILSRLAPREFVPQKYYTLIGAGTVRGVPCIISRTGYTGEAGFELYCAPERAEELWALLIEAGRDVPLVPCGLGARDTLRLEAAMPLYGHEMDETVTPFEAGLDFAVKMEKGDFIGKGALAHKTPPERKRVGLGVTGRGIVRGAEDVWAGDKLIGRTTSGTFCPFLKKPLAMALVKADFAGEGTKLNVDVRGRRVETLVTALPFYKRA